MRQKYVAAMVMAGVGDALGYYCGSWEFNFSGKNIHSEVEMLGGLSKLKNESKLTIPISKLVDLLRTDATDTFNIMYDFVGPLSNSAFRYVLLNIVIGDDCPILSLSC